MRTNGYIASGGDEISCVLPTLTSMLALPWLWELPTERRSNMILTCSFRQIREDRSLATWRESSWMLNMNNEQGKGKVVNDE